MAAKGGVKLEASKEGSCVTRSSVANRAAWRYCPTADSFEVIIPAATPEPGNMMLAAGAIGVFGFGARILRRRVAGRILERGRASLRAVIICDA